MKFWSKSIICISLFAQGVALAEYRVYQYMVTDLLKADPSRILTTTHNPRTVYSYQLNRQRYQASLMRTWMCPGHTGGKKELCASPYLAVLPKEGTNE